MYVPHERRALILRLLEQRGYLRTGSLAEELGVTEETIRTDIIALHERKLLTRVHGGARYIPPMGGEEDKTRLDCQLAELVMGHIEAGMSLYLDSGSLAHVLLPMLAERACRIFTPSLRLALGAAAPALGVQITLPGGALDKESQYIICEESGRSQLQRFRPDIALLLPPALPSAGSVAYHHPARSEWAAEASAAAKQTLIATAAHAFYTQAPCSASCTPALLITEDNLPPDFDHIPTELVPYLSPADLRREEE